MKAIALVVMVVAVGAILNATSPRGGGLSEDEGFKIAVPMLSTHVIQGDRQTVIVELKRDKYFKQDVTLRIEPAQGISVEPRNVEVKASESPEVLLQVTAPRDAALGKYLVHVEGTPERGSPTSIDFSVKVVTP
jgi:uncharacterized membrane protein